MIQKWLCTIYYLLLKVKAMLNNQNFANNSKKWYIFVVNKNKNHGNRILGKHPRRL